MMNIDKMINETIEELTELIKNQNMQLYDEFIEIKKQNNFIKLFIWLQERSKEKVFMKNIETLITELYYELRWASYLHGILQCF